MIHGRRAHTAGFGTIRCPRRRAFRHAEKTQVVTLRLQRGGGDEGDSDRVAEECFRAFARASRVMLSTRKSGACARGSGPWGGRSE